MKITLTLIFLSAGAMITGQLYGAESRIYLLNSIVQPGAPEIRNKQLYYVTDFVFSRAPENFWIYFDRKKQQLVIDVYGGRIKTPDDFNLSGHQVFKDVEIVNRETAMSLSGAQSLIFLKADAGWHYEASAVNKTVIRVTAWKPLSAPKTLAKSREKRRIFLYVMSAVAASVATFLIIIIAGRSGE